MFEHAKTGRRSAFVIYDEQIYKELKLYLLEQEQEISHYVWSLIAQDVSRIRATRTMVDPNTKITSFASQIPPPKIIDDFNHLIRPYLNKSNPEELRHLSENAYKTLNYVEYSFLADRLGIMPHEERMQREITYERADTELKHLRAKAGVNTKW